MNNMKNKILTAIIITLLTLTSLHAQNSSIVTKDIQILWLESKGYKTYQKEIKKGNTKEANKVKHETLGEITNKVLEIYIGDVKGKYKERMRANINELPSGLRTILADSYSRLRVLLDNPNEKDLNIFTYRLYSYVSSINKSKGTTGREALSLEKKFPELNGTPSMKLLINLGMI